MTRLLVPFSTPDVSAFTKTLKSFLDERHSAGKPPPSHVELLNLLARAVGLRNFATLKKTAQTVSSSGAAQPTKEISVDNVAQVLLAWRRCRQRCARHLSSLTMLAGLFGSLTSYLSSK